MNIIAHDPIAYLLGSWSSTSGTSSAIFRFLIALLLGAVIGWERSTKRHSAGFRTFILVMISGVGAMLLDTYIAASTGGTFFMISAAFLIAVSNISIHSVFYSSRNEIKGLTTATALWTTGLIGLLLGAGCYTLTAVAFAVLLIALAYFPIFEAYSKNRSNHFEVHLELTSSTHLPDFVTTIRKLGLVIDEIELNPAYAGSGLSVYSIAISISSEELKKYKTHKEIIEALRSLDYIYHIEEMHV